MRQTMRQLHHDLLRMNTELIKTRKELERYKRSGELCRIRLERTYNERKRAKKVDMTAV